MLVVTPPTFGTIIKTGCCEPVTGCISVSCWAAAAPPGWIIFTGVLKGWPATWKTVGTETREGEDRLVFAELATSVGFAEGGDWTYTAWATLGLAGKNVPTGLTVMPPPWALGSMILVGVLGALLDPLDDVVLYFLDDL